MKSSIYPLVVNIYIHIYILGASQKSKHVCYLFVFTNFIKASTCCDRLETVFVKLKIQILSIDVNFQLWWQFWRTRRKQTYFSSKVPFEYSVTTEITSIIYIRAIPCHGHYVSEKFWALFFLVAYIVQNIFCIFLYKTLRHNRTKLRLRPLEVCTSLPC